MGKGLYRKLAVTNLGKNRKYYFPYILSCTLMVMLHFLLCTLSMSSAWEVIPSNAVLYSILGLGTVVIEIFALILLLYTNGFLMKRRKREFGLYHVLGMEKRHIAKVLFWETLFAFAISIVLGLVLGCLMSKLAELVLFNLLHFEIRYSLELIPRAFIQTIGIFCLYALLILGRSLWQMRRSDPLELLHSTSVGERQPKANWLLAAIGIVLLGAGYYLALTIQDPVAALAWFFVAVILVILGTYACFIAGSVAVLKLLRKAKGYYYKPRHFVSVGLMIHRMKQNGAGLATICVLSTMVLVMISGTASLYVGNADILQNRYPRHINLSYRGTDADYGMAVAQEASQAALAERGLTAENLLAYRYTTFTALQSEDRLYIDQEALNNILSADAVIGVYLIPLEDYNALVEEPVELADDQVLVYLNRGGDYPYSTLTIGDTTCRVAQVLEDFPENGWSDATVISSIFLVVPDMETLENLLSYANSVYDRYDSDMMAMYSFDIDGDKQTQIGLYEAIRESTRYREDADISVESRAYEEQDFYALFGGLFFLGIFLGFLFLVATVLIIYYKQISEGYEDQVRFNTLQQVGMTKREVRKTIHSQVLTVFFLPLVVAGVHTAMAFPMIAKMLLMFALTNTKLLILTTLVTYLLFALVYSIVYWLTSRFYYRIASTKSH